MDYEELGKELIKNVVENQYKKIKEFTVVDVKEGDIGKGSAEEALKFV